MIALTLDFILKTAEHDGRKVHLTRGQLNLLHVLRMAAPGFARIDLMMESLWNVHKWPINPPHSLNCQIRGLRRAIAHLNLKIENRQSWGYRLVEVVHAKQTDQADVERTNA